MAAAGCRKNANFRGDSNPLGPGDPQNSKDAKKCSKKAFISSKFRTSNQWIYSPTTCL